MYLNFQNKSFWESLHLKYGLFDWDMAEELKLTITTEDIPQAPDKTPRYRRPKWQADPWVHWCWLPRALPNAKEPAIQPHLWMWVNPSLACPIPGSPGIDPAGYGSPVASVTAATETSSPTTSWDYSNLNRPKENVPSSFRKAGKITEDKDASRVDIPVPQETPEIPELGATAMPRKSAVLKPQSTKLKCPKQTSSKIKGAWPRPPLSYSSLITLALCNSTSGSLTAQQIYQFTRQHFPFFQMAPKGWKNTIRHNLCFSSCFEKTTGFVCDERNRKSCLWKLTPEGCRKFQEEAQALPKEALDLVRQSMSEPDLMRTLFGL